MEDVGWQQNFSKYVFLQILILESGKCLHVRKITLSKSKIKEEISKNWKQIEIKKKIIVYQIGNINCSKRIIISSNFHKKYFTFLWNIS